MSRNGGKPPPITSQDVKLLVDRLMAHGFAKLEICIAHGQIDWVEPAVKIKTPDELRLTKDLRFG